MAKKTEWILNELPPVAVGWRRCSDTVRVKLVGGSIVRGFYAWGEGISYNKGWYNYDRCIRIQGDEVVGWCYEKDYTGA